MDELMFNNAEWLLKAIEQQNPAVEVELAYSIPLLISPKVIDGEPTIILIADKIQHN